ncbi:MAG: DnaJ domain-containing protein [Gammaproteobacteria bacterium]|uniref:J domain-containing protein n=1 Tax=Vreelandella venusta TaxID=44935 RepID=UPI002285B031|nr:J domain-containing protein [Halomonas venusta]MBR9924078.1 DnaJ domain-containing protein [Gammaproteobacteria bacterium]WAM49439.1 DnaJ domain-containing protein [Halomonas venusta]
MSIARFSPFELLLLKSRSQVDTATLLLLAWVLVHRQQVSEGQRRRRLAQVTAQFRHGHELGPVMSIAHSQDLQAIQLAAEVVRKECSNERSLSILYQAITLATDDGELSLSNHYILGFLADLLNVTPATFGTLFHELTGKPLQSAEDPSRDAYWQVHDPEYHARKARDAQAAEQQAKEAEERQRANKEQQQQRQQHRQRQQEEAHREKARQQQAKQEQNKQEQNKREQDKQQERRKRQEQAQQRQRWQQEQKRQEEARRQQRERPSSPADRHTRALAVLGLTPGANRADIRRAYRRMAQLHHPDRFYSGSEHQVALASTRFQRIKSAYDYLMQNL